MEPLRVAIIGYGKIAADEHLPAIARDPRFALAAIVSRRSAGPAGIPCFASHEELLAEMRDLDAVAICTPPNIRYPIARDCLEAGLHTLLEKPPGVSVGEVEELARLAGERRVTLFAAWHSQHNPGVTEAASLLAGQRVEWMRIAWREDVRKWHPGQKWIWEPGGFGVFDPGINAFSIVSRIFPGTLLVREAELFFPADRQTPIAANIVFASPAATGPLSCELDWRGGGGEDWTIEIQSEAGDHLLISGGGARLLVNGKEIVSDGGGEYPAIYDRFAALVRSGSSSVDAVPLRMAADAFLLGRRTLVDPFEG